MFIRHSYQAKETGEGNTSAGGETSPPALDESRLAELIKQNVDTAVKEATASTRKQEEQKEETPPKEDFWSDIIDPRVDSKVARASLAAEAAQDLAEFYSSDFWSDEVEEWLTEEDPAKRKAERSALRKQIEETFQTGIKNNRPIRRHDIAEWALGQKITKDRAKYVENIGKKASQKREQELSKAQRGVDIASGNISDFDPASVHKMPFEKVVEQYGNIAF